MAKQRRYFRVQNYSEVVIVGFTEQNVLDDELIQEIIGELDLFIDQLSRKKILLDLNNISLLSSAALGKLIRFNERVKGIGVTLILCGLNAHISEYVKRTRINRLFNIQQDQETALQCF